MSVYVAIRDVTDIQGAVDALIEDAVEKALEDVVAEHDMKVEELLEEIDELRQVVRNLKQELDNLDN
jgi:polyhydroxyalkanoate synthesis regulator phasin